MAAGLSENKIMPLELGWPDPEWATVRRTLLAVGSDESTAGDKTKGLQ